MATTTFVWFDARRMPPGPPVYVALGSSFAAGAGLGGLQAASPLLCARSVNGYPSHLASRLKIKLVDMSCGGAVTRHLIDGGQFFQGPQLRAIARRTRLVTITVGGNDLGYARDLSFLAARNTGSAFGWAVRQFWGGPQPIGDSRFTQLENDLADAVAKIRGRAPAATVVLATYPAILPRSGTCPRLALSREEATLMRALADRFAATMRAAAERSGALLVDMNAIGAAHHACSADPWTYGWRNASAAPFHPTLAGTRATALAIANALAAHQQL